MEIKVITAGNCIICGSEIKIVTKNEKEEWPDIFFCSNCTQRMAKESEDKNGTM